VKKGTISLKNVSCGVGKKMTSSILISFYILNNKPAFTRDYYILI